MDFIQATGHRFQTIPVDLPVQWRQEDSEGVADVGKWAGVHTYLRALSPLPLGYQLPDVLQAIAISYPQLGAYEDVSCQMITKRHCRRLTVSSVCYWHARGCCDI